MNGCTVAMGSSKAILKQGHEIIMVGTPRKVRAFCRRNNIEALWV